MTPMMMSVMMPDIQDSNDDNPDDTSHEMTSDDTVMPRGCLEVVQSNKLFLIQTLF